MSEECKVKHEQLSSDISVLLERIKNIHDEEVLLRNDLRNNLLDETRFTDELRLVKLGQQANLQEYVNQISVLEECIQQVETDLASLKKRISERIESGGERRE